MKRRIFTFLLAAALVLLTACSGRGVVRPPVRIGEGTGNACFNRSFSLTEAFEEADVVALVQVGNWLGEKTEGFPYTYYEADALECYKGDIPAHFTLMQSGASTSTYEDYPLYTYGNQLLLFLDQTQTDWGEAYIQYPGAYVNVCSFITMTLGQPLSRMQESTVKELRADLEKTDPLLAESLSFGERQNSFLEPYVYTQDALETLFASLNQG